jgi:hypothetical protein
VHSIVLHSFLPNGYWGAGSPGVKLPGRGADHAPPNNAEVKKKWTVHPLHGVVFNWLRTGTNLTFTRLFNDTIPLEETEESDTFLFKVE